VGAAVAVTVGGADVGLGGIRLGVALWAGAAGVDRWVTVGAGEVQAPKEVRRIRKLEVKSDPSRGRTRASERCGDP
jgi:hypothetical protein